VNVVKHKDVRSFVHSFIQHPFIRRITSKDGLLACLLASHVMGFPFRISLSSPSSLLLLVPFFKNRDGENDDFYEPLN